MYCHDCHYDLRASDERCPECGRPFQRSDRTSYSRWSLREWKVLRALAAFDHWGFYLVSAIVFTVMALLFDNIGSRIIMALLVLGDLCALFRRAWKGPTHFERKVRGSAR